MRATKIVATLGPASSSPEVLERMMRAGVDVVRLNFSHGKAQDHIDRANLVREVAARAGKEVAIMADLQGPKIRVGKFDGGSTVLQPGQAFILDGATTELGNNERVGLDYKDLPRDVKPGDTLLLNDGLLKLTVEAVRGDEVHTTVLVRRASSAALPAISAERVTCCAMLPIDAVSSSVAEATVPTLVEAWLDAAAAAAVMFAVSALLRLIDEESSCI